MIPLSLVRSGLSAADFSGVRASPTRPASVLILCCPSPALLGRPPRLSTRSGSFLLSILTANLSRWWANDCDCDCDLFVTSGLPRRFGYREVGAAVDVEAVLYTERKVGGKGAMEQSFAAAWWRSTD